MIKLGVMSLSYKRMFGAGQMDILQFIERCGDLRVEGVDFNARSFGSESAETLKTAKYRCLMRGLSVACVSIPNNFGKPAAALPAEIEMVKRWIDHALLLGAPLVRVFAGYPNAEEPRTATWERCRAALQTVADYGHDVGIVVALQNHNHGALTENGDDVLRFLDGAGPWLSHVWDTGQYVGSPGASGADAAQGAQEVLYQSLEQTVDRACHVRFKFYRVESGVERWLDYPRILRMLRRRRYNGFVSLVYEGQGDELADVQKAVTYTRTLLAQEE